MQLLKGRIKQILDSFAGKRILVLGDLMIDEYLSGRVSRLSPEAPVPIVEIEDEVLRFGGAANVALNIKSLGCEPLMIGLVGKDRMGSIFNALMLESQLDTRGLIFSNTRPTTVKTRIIGDNQHIARVDKEKSNAADQEERSLIKAKINELLQEADSVILEDYNKGVLAKGIIEFIIDRCKFNNKPIFVDPKFVNFMNYKGVTLFKPNIKEAQQALARIMETEQQIEEAGFTLKHTLQVANILLTRGSSGMTLIDENDNVTHIPTQAKKVADVSGAGDTVISTLAASCLGGATYKEAALLANMAAGIVVEDVGIVPIQRDKLLNF